MKLTREFMYTTRPRNPFQQCVLSGATPCQVACTNKEGEGCYGGAAGETHATDAGTLVWSLTLEERDIMGITDSDSL